MRTHTGSVWRQLFFIPALLAATACNAGTPVSPDSVRLNIRLRNDAGGTAGRNQVLVTRTDGASGSHQASIDGSGDITLTGPGTYLVRVIPRAGFVSTPQLRREVTVSTGERLTVSFTLYREGMPTDYWPPIEGWGN